MAPFHDKRTGVPGSGGVTLVSIAVTPSPSAPMIGGLGNTQQFTATGTFSDASTEDLTSAVVWASSAAGVASVSNGSEGGVATALLPGDTNLTATLGVIVSPAVSLHVTLGVDFTAPSIPATVTASRAAGAAGALIWPVDDSGTALIQTPIDGSLLGSPIREQRANLPPGWWSFKGYQNILADPNNFAVNAAPNFWRALGPIPYGEVASVTSTLLTAINGPYGPDGKSNVYNVAVVQPFPNARHYAALFNNPGAIFGDPWLSFPGVWSLWMQGEPSNPSNIGGMFSFFSAASASGATWRDVEYPRLGRNFSNWYQNSRNWYRGALISAFPPLSGGLAGGTAGSIMPSTLHGLDPSFGVGLNPGDADEGSLNVAFGQLTSDADFYMAHALSDLPTVKGTVGGTQFGLTTPANAIDLGELDIEFTFIPGWLDCGAMQGPQNPHNPALNPPWDGLYMWAGQTPDGELSLRYDDAVFGGAWILRVRGVDVLSLVANDCPMWANNDQVCTIRAWYKPLTSGQCGLRFTVNGAFQPASTAAAVGAALASPTTFYLLQKPFANVLVTQPWQTPGMLTGALKVYPHNTSTADPSRPGMVVVLGDSLIRSNPRYVATTSYIWSPLEAMAGAPLLATLALGGNTIADQKTVWDASPYKGDPNVAAVIISAGVNDINQNHTLAQMVIDANALIADIAAANPTAKIIICPIAPEFTYMTAHPVGGGAAAMETIRIGYNSDLYNGTIVGMNDVAEDHITPLTAADGMTLEASVDVGTNLAAADGLHYTTDGRRYQHGPSLRRALARQGVKP
jgi:hypothetical protein